MDMPYDPDWMPSGGWEVDDVYDKIWNEQGGLESGDNLTFHGDGKGPDGQDLLKRNGRPLATNCLHADTKEEVEVSFNGDTYVIQLDAPEAPEDPEAPKDPKTLTCIKKGQSSGNASWTAVEGGRM